MALRSLLGCLLVVGLGAACSDKDEPLKVPGGSPDFAKRCERLANTCGAEDKHKAKILAQCQEAIASQTERGCASEVAAAYDCYEKELCGKADEVWALDDFRVLGDRHKKCVAERNAVRDCLAKK